MGKSAVAKKEVFEFTSNTEKYIGILIKEISEGKNSIAERICETILEDIDKLCKLTKFYSEKIVGETFGINLSIHWVNEGPLRGTYVGLGIGERYISLGFLENSIIQKLREKLGAMSSGYKKHSLVEYPTIMGMMRSQTETFITSNGVYELCRTHSWFLTKKVE